MAHGATTAAPPDRATVSALVQRLYAGVPGRRGRQARWRPVICPFEAVLAFVPAGARVLDIGCGSGLVLTLAAATGRCAAGTGVDPDAAAVAVARAVATTHGYTHLAFSPLVPGAPLPGGPADAVTLVDVLHHVAPGARDALVRSAAAAVAPGGVLIVKEMCRRPWWRAFANWFHDLVVTRQWIHHVDPAEVEASAGAAGLVLTHAARIPRFWYGHELRVFGRPPAPAS